MKNYSPHYFDIHISITNFNPQAFVTIIKEVNENGEATKLSFDDPHGGTKLGDDVAFTYEQIISLIATRTHLSSEIVSDTLDRNGFHKTYLVNYANKTPSLLSFLVQTFIAQTKDPP